MSLEKLISKYLTKNEHPRNPKVKCQKSLKLQEEHCHHFKILLIKGSHGEENSTSVIEEETDIPFQTNEDPKKVSWDPAVSESSMTQIALCTLRDAYSTIPCEKVIYFKRKTNRSCEMFKFMLET